MTKRPNILLLVLDATRQDHTSVHGYDRPTTPNLERMASHGYRFDNAFAAAPWTPPSHGSMFSGVHPSSHRYFDNGLEFTPPHPPLAEQLESVGYRTFGTTVNVKIGGNMEVTRGFGEYGDIWRLPFWPSDESELFDYYIDLHRGYLRLLLDWTSCRFKPVEHLSNCYLEQRISEYSDSGPFFGFININRPHTPYDPPKRYREQFDHPDQTRTETGKALLNRGRHRYMAGEIEPTAADWAFVRDRYDGEIAFADALVGNIIERLRAEDIYEETLIVVTADHGEHFGEHRRAGHQFSLFDEVLHVPLLVKPAGEKNEEVVDDSLVSHIDIYPTLLEAAGVPVPDTARGDSLLKAPGHDVVFAEYACPNDILNTLIDDTENPVEPDVIAELDYSLQCARTESEKYIREVGGEDKQYEVDRNTTPKDTLLEEAELSYLAEQIHSMLSNDLEIEDQDPVDPAVRENLRKLGYL